MSLVIITQDGPEHRYVANKILACHQVEAIVIVDAPTRRSWKKVYQKSPIRFLNKALRYVFLRIVGDSTVRLQTLSRILGSDAEKFLRPDLIVNVGHHKGQALEETISQLAPSVIAIYGTGIIPDTILSQARSVALNMHTGISPLYRGVSCYIWPLINKDPDSIGATIHECTSKIDGGKIFHTAKASLYCGDNIHAVFCRSVIAGAAGYTKVISDALSDTLEGVSQDLSIGREYHGSMIGLISEIRVRAEISKSWPESKSVT